MLMKQESLFIHAGHHQLHLRHIYKVKGGAPILMLHGSIENGKIFYTEKGKGLGCYLADQGFDVFIADFRGKGKSLPPIHEDTNHGQFEMITQDVPELLQYVHDKTGKKVHLICHSWGGVILASSLIRKPHLADLISSKLCFGTKRSIRIKSFEKFIKLDLLWNKLLPHIARKTGYVNAEKLKFGADSETLSFLQQSSQWINKGEWQDPVDKYDYIGQVSQVNWPATWHITGIKDSLLGNVHDVRGFIDEYNKDSKFNLLSKENGNKLDYDHINILTHPEAINDHFPDIVDWLNKHT
ncbi:alpha/beta fold hydrolase [Colwellia sp. RSH04]|nr:alpha/beta fold hydrolase [Colwellia sp. RSH04]